MEHEKNRIDILNRTNGCVIMYVLGGSALIIQKQEHYAVLFTKQFEQLVLPVSAAELMSALAVSST
jgi:hypothetical protein